MKALKKNLMMQMTAVLLAFVCVFGMTAAAEEASSDYYLYDLGLQNGQLQEDWEYYNTEYNVVVPEGTQSLELSPELSNYAANIVEITDTTIGEDGTATVDVTVEAENGAQLTYTLHVTTEGAAPAAAEENAEAAEGQTEAPKAEEKDAAQAALESEANLRAQIESEAAIREQASQEKIQSLNGDIASLNNKIDMILKVCYGLIALCVVLLFFIINQSLRNKDLKEELKDANSMAGDSYEFARRTQSMRTDNYYAPAQNAAPAEEMPQEPQLSKREQKA
ncbi:MAG: cadherin-like beta sandwich domain-containing protein, partial [Eubacteriales bacterium]|nr:cadherin-like beta sandwich domain-containing protein [Eubacteriales bacterium]